ncbi:MAG TPA: cyclase family protein [Pyrinomonadaceae bacterium]|jgi:arylformamidase|nr:cyclase family protein [Pyrinomonadaceae bacterium]
MRLFDVSVPISALTPTYPGDPGIHLREWLSLEKGDAANVTVLYFGAHTGTHIDAPAHFVKGGAKLDSLSLNTLLGEVRVIEIPEDVYEITESLVETLCPAGPTRVLFKTRNSNFWNEQTGEFHTDYTYISSGAARRLVSNGIQLVGIDYLSVERYQSDNFETHEVLLSNGVVIIEGLDLRDVPGGVYELICLPIKIAGGSGDGAPARVVLRSET